MEYIRRGLEEKFLEYSSFFKIVMLTGARQIGKTTMLQRLAQGEERMYVTMDDSRARSLARKDPEVFFQTYRLPILIDEVQYAPELFPYMKMLADSTELSGQIWLTGSQHYGAIRNMRESLAGRIGLLQMHSLSQAELLDKVPAAPIRYEWDFWARRAREWGTQGAPEVFERVWRGGMPAVQGVGAGMWRAFFDSYVDSYLMRDITELGGVNERAKYRDFLSAAAALIGQQVNYAKLADTIGVSQSTAKRWLQLLSELGIVFLLSPFSANALKRLARTPKLYFQDTGLAAYLTEWPNAATLRTGPSSGAFFENYVVMEFVRSYSFGTGAVSFSYFRDSNRKEIDLLVNDEGVIHPIEIKQSGSPDAREVKKFRSLDESGRTRGTGAICCLSREALPIDAENFWLPASVI